ncbi:CopG family transcriptional regulator [Candidatus Saccharibacteria bacterium CPR2]|nr:CopG family transcriptional regulator [Candidatus Saccharibacteria bacterium CPR2]
MRLCYSGVMRTTITLNDKLYKTLKVQAAASGESLSTLIEEAIKHQLLEDIEDLQDIKDRENDPTFLFDDLVKEFKKEGLL